MTAKRVQLGWTAVCALALCSTLGCDAVDEDLLDRKLPRSDGGKVADGGDDLDDAAQPTPDSGLVSTNSPDAAAEVECQAAVEFPSCQRAHAQAICVREQCVVAACDAPWVDCDGDASNGCETTLDSVDDCGLCGASCARPHAKVACEDGRCEQVGCAKSYGDCDKDPSTGCETPLDTVANCGDCEGACDALANAAPGCVGGSCGIGLCLGPFGDCNDLAVDGCEQMLATEEHCGDCASPCTPKNAIGTCATGQCAITSCEGAAEDCNGLAPDGCEASLTSVEHCGACGASCDLPLHAAAVTCDDSTVKCVVDHECAPGDAGCVPDAAENGCEAGYADCDGLGTNGCEIPLGTLANCGGCGEACDEANAVSACVSGSCERTSCLPGYGDCGGGSCTWLGGDTAHCGACETSCSGGTPQCTGGDCTDQSCSAGTADCDTGMAGCETNITTVTACGQCGLACGPYAHASAACSAGRCAIGTCDAGYLDCDGAIWNGCEVDGRTTESCGSCNAVCVIPHAEESCSTGSCVLVTCDDDRANCDNNVSNGCEASTTLPNNCGSCGNDCTGRPHTQAGGCKDGACELVCENGYRDCNGDPPDGCEAELGSPENCGECGNDCTALPNVAAAMCSDSVCAELVCDPGYADCDGITSNGCERSTRTLTDCGGCDAPCAIPNANASCSNGTCTMTGCKPGYGNCNGGALDGCETSLNEPATCGSCNKACANELECANGLCQCSTNAQCGNAREDCCGGGCIDTQSQCSWWPCPVATTSRDVVNCGGCGNDCRLLAGMFFCCAI